MSQILIILIVVVTDQKYEHVQDLWHHSIFGIFLETKNIKISWDEQEVYGLQDIGPTGASLIIIKQAYDTVTGLVIVHQCSHAV